MLTKRIFVALCLAAFGCHLVWAAILNRSLRQFPATYLLDLDPGHLVQLLVTVVLFAGYFLLPLYPALWIEKRYALGTPAKIALGLLAFSIGGALASPLWRRLEIELAASAGLISGVIFGVVAYSPGWRDG